MRRYSVFLAWLLATATQAALPAELTILTENLPPLNYVRYGELVGPSVEIVREIQKRVGSREKIQVHPWSRAYKRILDEDNVVLFGMTHTEERHHQFKWVGPLARKRDILVARKASNIVINSLDDDKEVKAIGTLRDDTREVFLKDYGFANLESVSDEQLNTRKLMFGRIDLWAFKIPGLKTVCELAGVDHTKLEEVFSLREIDVSIAFSKGTPDTIVQEWQRAFGEMTEDGTVARIRSRWDAE